MNTFSNPREKGRVGLLLAFTGFLLIILLSSVYAKEYGSRLAEDKVATGSGGRRAPTR